MLAGPQLLISCFSHCGEGSLTAGGLGVGLGVDVSVGSPGVGEGGGGVFVGAVVPETAVETGVGISPMG